MSMSLTEEEIKAWWDEVERELAKQVLPEMPKFVPQPEQPVIYNFPTQVVYSRGGNDVYTLHDDYQFPVDSDYPNAQGWKHV